MKQLLLVFSVVGVIASVMIPLWNEYVAVAVCCALVIGFVVLQRSSNESAATISARADHVYLLGYLFTISALFGIAIRFLVQPDSFKNHSGGILYFAGLKLSTTVVGLIALLHLKAAALDKERGSLTTPVVDIPSFENLSPLLQQLIQIVIESRKQDLQHLIQAQAALVKNIDETSKELAKLKGSVKSFHEGVDSVTKNMTTLKTTTDATNGALTKANEQTNKLWQFQEQANVHMAEFSKNVKETKSVLNDFIDVTKIKVDAL